MGTRALEANLRRTAVEVVIPDEHRVLLEITAAYQGVHQRTEDLLREIHHRYVGWAQTLDDLHRQATGNLHYYNTHERGAEGLVLLSSFYEKVATEADSPGVRDRALRFWLRFLEKVAAESRDEPERSLRVLSEALERIEPLLSVEPTREADATPGLKRLVTAIALMGDEARPALERAAKALAGGLDRLYTDWLRREDPAAWWEEDSQREGATPTTDRPPGIDRIAHKALRTCRDLSRKFESLGELSPQVHELLELPDYAQLLRGYLTATARPRGETDSFLEVRWLNRILGSAALAPIHESVLHRMARLCSEVVVSQDASGQQAFIREIMGLLGRMDPQCDSSSLELVRRLGLKVLECGEHETAAVFVEEALAQGFHHPRFAGYTDSWSIRVNATHKHNIRAHLDLVGANPTAARALLAALTIRLKIGGVFLADTDLLHRDVSRFLAKDIGPVYHHAKQLLRLLPVYFTDIGAEGELRRVSTRLDELQGRSDALCHFLRKQSHVESNPLLTRVVESVAEYWATGDPIGLRGYLPPSVYQTLKYGCTDQAGLHRTLRTLVGQVGGVERLFELDFEGLRTRIASVPDADPVDSEKAELLLRFHRELERKYELDHEDLLDRLAAYPHLSAATMGAIEDALGDGDGTRALEHLLGTLEALQEVILSTGSPEAVEDIYLKRHIAVGIPSMYGSYREERLEALGLTYRIESLASALLARRIQSFELTGDRILDELGDVCACLAQLQRALRVDGFDTTPRVSTAIAMLEEALGRGVHCESQFLDIFHLLSKGVEEAVQTYCVDFYGDHLDRLVNEMAEDGVLSPSTTAHAKLGLESSEEFIRSMITESFGLQLMDNLCARVIRALNVHGIRVEAAEVGAPEHHEAPVSWTVPLGQTGTPGLIRLGNKGANLQRLAQHGFPVPPGFIIATDLFAQSRTVRDGSSWARKLAETIRADVQRLEEETGARLGDPHRPLLLSVRAGSPISMPGMLDSLLNVGINPWLAQQIAEHRGHAWAAWDAYRRFVQLWGMSHGMERDLFDQLIHRAKADYGVAKKALLPADGMRKLALEYRGLVTDHAIPLIDDPFDQLLQCIELVLRSWDATKARLYRRELHIAEEWGTAVVIQSMVFGNLHSRSGTGVVQTRPSAHDPAKIRLRGDFIVQGQGDDVVSGLVETLPITEQQRHEQAKHARRSLEKDFPPVYEALLRHATRMVHELGMAQQEIEFTFEDGEAEALYLLQTRDAGLSGRDSFPTFIPGAALDQAHVATGIGAGGGALSGRVARTQPEIDLLHSHHPGEAVILIRPDTVPEDIHLVLQTDGLLTSVGGATSHAAVVAKRLSKTCVVGCTELDVYADEAEASLLGRPLTAGDLVSINGMDGFVYLGSHPTTTAGGK